MELNNNGLGAQNMVYKTGLNCYFKICKKKKKKMN